MAKEKVTCENSSGSRLRDNVTKIFDCFLIVSRPVGSDTEPSADYKYPPAFDDAEIVQQSLLFCFPFDSNPDTLTSFKDSADHFTFILTDIEGKHRFGFCKLANEGLKCYCILSFVPWFEIFYKILNYTHELSSQSDIETMETMLLELMQQDVPKPEEKFQISATLAFQTPDSSALPSIPVNRNLSEYYTAADASFMMEMFANLLFERRVVFTSDRLSILTSSIHSAEALLRPLHWQHIFIPVMPPHLLDYCLAPMPYLVGVHKSLMHKVREMIAMDDDIIVADIDTGEIESVHNDLERIPNDKVSFLKSLLRKPDVGMGTNLSMAFLRTQARLIGGYRNGLKFKREEAIIFNEETFIEYHRSNTGKEFARELVQSQTFKQFVDGRLEMLNAGVGFRDIFENEVNMVDAARESDRDTYKEWLTAAKKGGNKLIMQFQRRAKDNMKVAQQSFKNYLKQPPVKQQATQVCRKKSLDETAQRIRPSRPTRPASISSDRIPEGKVAMHPPPFLLLDPPKPPMRKKKAVRYSKRHTRKYTTVNLDDVLTATPDDDAAGKSPGDRERTLSNATYTGVDMDLLADMQLVMDEKITNLSSTANEPEQTQQQDFLLDFSDSAQTNEGPPAGSRQETLEKRHSSEIRRQKRVSSRPQFFITSHSKQQSYSSDEQSPERYLEIDSTSRQLIDLSVTSDSTKISCKITPSQPSATIDLIGLDFGTTPCEQPIDSSQTFASWDNKEAKAATKPPLEKSTNPFVTMSTAPQNISETISAPANPPDLQNTPPKRDPSIGVPHKLSPDKLNPFKVSTATVVPNYGNFTRMNKDVTIATLYLPGAQPIRPSLNHLEHNPLVRSMSGQPFVVRNQYTKPCRDTNPFSSEASQDRVKNAKVTGLLGNGGVSHGGSLRNLPSTDKDNELFSDLLNSWKSKEGL